MGETTGSDVTKLLEASGRGDRKALEALVAAIEPKLRSLAARRLSDERPNHTLQPTALVNEFYLDLFRGKSVEWRSRAHFFAIAAHRMRRILIDHARKRAASKRGGGAQMVTLDEDLKAAESVDVLDLHQALKELADLDARQGRIMELHYFGGLGVGEIAEVEAVGTATVMRDLRAARAWLALRLGPEGSRGDHGS